MALHMVSKLHLLISIVMFALIAFMAIQEDESTRIMLLVPIVVLFVVYQIMYGIELISSKERRPTKI